MIKYVWMIIEFEKYFENINDCLSMENLSKLKIISHLNHSIVVKAHKSFSCHTEWEALGAQVWILLCARWLPVEHTHPHSRCPALASQPNRGTEL